MKSYNSRWQLAEAQSSNWAFAPSSLRPGKIETLTGKPVSQQIMSWLLFWPLLTLIARQVPYFSGPARTAEDYQHGAAMSGVGPSHLYLYFNLLLLLGFVLAGYRQVWAAVKANLLIPGLLALIVCSALWSTSATVTLQMCVEVGLCTLFACYLSVRYTAEHLMQLMIFMGVAAALLSIFFALALPSYGIFQGYTGGAWQGICKHKNALGISMAYLLTPVFFTDAYGRARKLIYCTLLLFIVFMCQSRGAWADTAGMLLFVGWLGLIRRLRNREVSLILLMTLTVTAAGVALGVHFWPLLAQSMGKDPTMTGRTEIYREIWRSIMKRPLLGYGFGGFWYAGSIESQRVALALAWPNIGYAESGILEVALQIGFVGVAAIIALLAKAAIQGARLLRSPHYSPRVGWFVTILFLATLTNLDAGWFLTSDTLDWVLILVACIGLNEEMRRTRSLPRAEAVGVARV